MILRRLALIIFLGIIFTKPLWALGDKDVLIDRMAENGLLQAQEAEKIKQQAVSSGQEAQDNKLRYRFANPLATTKAETGALKEAPAAVEEKLSAASSTSASSETDILVDTMLEQGLLRPEEAEQVKRRTNLKRQEIEENQRFELARAQKFNIKGDVAIRYQQSKNKLVTDPYQRHRGRLRLRLGFYSQLFDETVKLAGGLATGTGDPRSSFIDFGNSFEKGSIRLDYCYLEWKAFKKIKFRPLKNSSLIAGQFPREDYLWAPTDLMWDPDMNPQGAGLHLEFAFNPKLQFFWNQGVGLLQESAAIREDPTMYWFQPGIQFNSDHFDFKLAAIRYIYNDLEGRSLSYRSGTNTGYTIGPTSVTGRLVFDYDSGGASGEAGYSFRFLDNKMKRLAFFGDYIRNLTDGYDPITKTSAGQNRNGWAVGVRLGDSLIENFGDWQMMYQYTVVQKNAILDIFPSSDRYDGYTDVNGFNTGFDFGLGKNFIFKGAFYRYDRIRGTKSRKTMAYASINCTF